MSQRTELLELVRVTWVPGSCEEDRIHEGLEQRQLRLIGDVRERFGWNAFDELGEAVFSHTLHGGFPYVELRRQVKLRDDVPLADYTAELARAS